METEQSSEVVILDELEASLSCACQAGSDNPFQS